MNAKEANRRSRVGQAAAEKHEPGLRDKYEAVLRANARRVSRAYRSTGIDVAGEGVPKKHLVAAGGKVPTLDEVLAQATLAASATARTRAERQRIAEAAAHPIITDAGKRELRDLLEPFVAAQAGVQAERIVAGVRDRVAAIMLEALTEGYSVADTAALLQANLELDAAWQAEMLARTDLIALSNAGSHAAAASLEDGPKFKTWLSAGDNRVRPTHVDANGQVQPIDMPYRLAEGVELQYPGDPSGPDGEVINCRCVSVFTDTATATLKPSSEGGIHDEPVTAFDATTAAGAFDEAKHPRHPKGEHEGGRFARAAEAAAAAGFATPEDAAAEVELLRDNPQYAEMSDEDLLAVQARLSQRVHGNSLSGLVGTRDRLKDPNLTPTERAEFEGVERRYADVGKVVSARRASAEFAREQQAKAESAATGKLTLSKAEMVDVLGQAGDVYVDNKYQGDYNPDLFITSDLSGKPIRHYVKLPDGSVAHPDEIHESRKRGRLIVVPNVAAPRDRPTHRSDVLPPDVKETLVETAPATTAAGFTEALHPRHPKGEHLGGKFAPSTLTPTHSADLDAEVDDRHAEQVQEYAYKRGISADEYLDASSRWIAGEAQGQEVRIRAPLDSVKPILEQGFKTADQLREAGVDASTWGRRELEQQYFGAVDPTYGYLSGIPEDNGHSVTAYGEAVFRMKPEVALRSTLTLGDSANVITDEFRDGVDFVPTPLAHPDQRSIDFKSTGDVLGSDLRDYRGVYLETQTWGGVNVNDVQEVVFTEGTTPDGPTVEALGKAGVPWRSVPSSDPNPPPVLVKAGDVLPHRTWVEADGTPTPMTVDSVTDDGYVVYRLPQDTEPRGDSLRAFYWMAGMDADAKAITAAGFVEALHPRYQRGNERGGQFAPKDGTSSATATKEANEAAAKKQEVDQSVAPGQLELTEPLTAERSMGRDVRLTGKLADGKVYRVQSIKGVGTKATTLVTLVDAEGKTRNVFGHVQVEDVSGGFQAPDAPVSPAPAGPATPTPVPAGPQTPAPEPVPAPPAPEPPKPAPPPAPPPPPPPVLPPAPPKPAPAPEPVAGSPAVNRPVAVKAIKPGEKFKDHTGTEYTMVGPYRPRPRTYVQVTDATGQTRIMRLTNQAYVEPGHPALAREAKTNVSHVEGVYGPIFKKTPAKTNEITKAASTASLEASHVLALPPELPKIELKETRSNSASGQYWSQGATPQKITLRQGSPEKMVNTMHHETGHYLDHGVLGPLTTPDTSGKTYRSDMYASSIRHPEVMGPVMDAIDRSDAIARVNEIAGHTGQYKIVSNAGTQYEKGYNADRKHARYLLEPTEKWARAHEQYQATKEARRLGGAAGEARMSEYRTGAALPLDVKSTELTDSMALAMGEPGVSSRAYYGWYWTPEDFAPIEAEIDAMFGRVGWLKK